MNGFWSGFVTGALFVILGVLGLCAAIANDDDDRDDPDDNQRGTD